MFLAERKNVALTNICSSGEEEEDKEEVGNDDAEQMMARRTTMVPDSLMPNDDDDENDLSRVPVGRTPTPKRKTKKRTREMTKDDENDDTEREEEEEEETMVVTNTQVTTPAKAQKTTRSLDATKKSYSSSHRHHQHRQRMRSPLMETQKNATEEDEEEDSEEFKGRSLSPTAEFREAQKIAFNSTNEKKKTKEFTEYDDDDEEEETFDILKKKEENLVNVNAYGETIRVADTLAIDNVNNNDNNITEERDDDDENNKTSTKKRGRGKVDFQFGDRHTEEQDFEDGKNGVVAVAETFTPIRETVPAPSGMHVCDDDDEEKEDKDEKEADEKDGVLPLREIFRAKHLIDPRDASRTAPVLEVQVLRDESFSYRHVAARTTIQTIQTTTPKTAVKNHDHYLAYEIDHEIRDATEISVWKIETDNCSSSSSSRRERSGSDDSKTMSRFSFKGTVLIGKPSARDGRTSSSSKGGGGNGGGKTMKRWAFSIAPNGLVFTSSYKKSSLLSMMDETERTHGSNNSSDSDDYSDDSDDEDTYLYGMNSAERRRRFPRKSGVYVHDPVDVNEEESVHKKDPSLGSEKKSNQSQKRRSSGRRRSKTPRDSFGNSMADTKKNQKTTKKQTYFELQSPGMAGKVRPRKFASAFSEEYDETVFRLAGVGAEGKCRLWTWSCENNEDFDDDVNGDDEKKMSSSSSKKKSKSKNKTKFSTAKICAKSVTHCKDFEIPTYKSHCVSRECEITSLSFSKDGNVLACVFDKKHVVVWDASTTRVVFSYYCTEYEIERDGLRVLDNNKKMMKQRGQKSTPSRPNASNSKMKKKKSTFTTSADATSTGGGGPIFFFGNFRKISSSSDSSSPSSVATFACAYNKELVVGPNASWESLNKANNGSDIVSAVAVCPDVFVEEDDEEDEEEEDDEEEDDEYDVKMIKAASKRNTTVNVVVTNAGRLGVFEAFGHANEATHAYEGLTFTKRHAFDEEDVNDDGKTNKSHKKKAFQGNFLCASHGNLFAVARKRPGCVSLYAQENHHHFEESF
ncbi:unknown protein [Bathycoccus prasinos]|uniref:Uncharacterized protein n=1 Tax=Bathycoccus prasinos TaxID=41875 RepID=K8FD69_9CHLO|nr:unknown protein [Bathycoccus prasinos]CCO20183.1 unknown protein [Bathycoccus prasinos]|eukprot:XP_007508566.1 unknown protein [Bathycoccus prasinos]